MSTNQSSALGFLPQVVCAISVRNLHKSIAWYQEKLGFKLLYTIEEIAWSELETPVEGAILGLSQVENPEVKGAVLTWHVDNVDHARGLLEAAGVKLLARPAPFPTWSGLPVFMTPMATLTCWRKG
jgi:catechol 2,3-dioxygenase-like lactoylglutathione lyase family enzyme